MKKSYKVQMRSGGDGEDSAKNDKSNMFLRRSLQLLALSLPVYFSLATAATVSNSATSLTLLYQNNLNASDDGNHIGFLYLDAVAQADASSACAALGEKLLPQASIQSHSPDVVSSLSYLAYANRVGRRQSYYIDTGVASFVFGTQALTFGAAPKGGSALPVLCTQSSTSSQPGNSFASATNQISVSSTGNTYVGFRNQKSFRFQGIPYANKPERFVYSTLYTPVGQTINVTSYGAQCAQGGSGSEDCLFLNIQTPYIPKAGDTSDLRPVMFWIHGGGFTGGTGADPGSDGGNLASREDIVVVTINYRLSTLGFLAIPGTNITGNYGIADQITALDVSFQLYMT